MAESVSSCLGVHEGSHGLAKMCASQRLRRIGLLRDREVRSRECGRTARQRKDLAQLDTTAISKNAFGSAAVAARSG